MTDNEILEIADKVTADFEGHSFFRHGEDQWAIEFARRIIAAITKPRNRAKPITDAPPLIVRYQDTGEVIRELDAVDVASLIKKQQTARNRYLNDDGRKAYKFPVTSDVSEYVKHFVSLNHLTS